MEIEEMWLRSSSVRDGFVIKPSLAAGDFGKFGGNRNPHLEWSKGPPGTCSFALFCTDVDVPTNPATVGRYDCTIPFDQPRGSFSHWVMVDIPAHVREIGEGSCSDGFVVGGKESPWGPAGSRQGVNDFTHWFKGDPRMAGTYVGYDGPYPPFNDERPHLYLFQIYALGVPTLQLPELFDATLAKSKMASHILAQAEFSGSYTLNRALLEMAQMSWK